MQCRDFRQLADSYLSDELLIETNHDLLQHLEACPACRNELAARRNLRTRLRAGFIAAPALQMPPEFGQRLQAQLRADALKRNRFSWIGSFSRNRQWLAVAACLVLIAGAGVAVWQHRQSVSRSQPAIAELVRRELSTAAAGDHRDCAVKFKLAEAPISLVEAGNKFDRSYLELAQAVMSGKSQAGLPLEFVEAHSCVFQGRRFAHVVLKYNNRLVSFLVTDLDSADRPSGGASAMTASDQQVIACSREGGYQVSCFQTGRHMAFVVSDLPEAENLLVARAIAPAVYEHIVRAERAA